MLSLASIATATVGLPQSAVIDPLCRDLDSLSTGRRCRTCVDAGPPAAEGSRDAIRLTTGVDLLHRSDDRGMALPGTAFLMADRSDDHLTQSPASIVIA